MCYSSERFRLVFSIIYFIYDSINCPTTVGGGVVGSGRKRQSADIFGKLKLAPRKSKLPLDERQLSCHHHVNDSSRSYHAIRSVCHCGTANRDTCDGVMLQACVDHSYLLYRIVDYEKRAWWLFGTIFMQYLLKEEQRQAVLGLLGQKDVVAVLPTGFGKSLITSCSRQWNSNKGKRIWY